jgi:hypothetical protein
VAQSSGRAASQTSHGPVTARRARWTQLRSLVPATELANIQPRHPLSRIRCARVGNRTRATVRGTALSEAMRGTTLSEASDDIASRQAAARSDDASPPR